jgi:drug/metabolite transporter (DMT)-like permease
LVPALIAVMGVAIIELKGAGGNPTWGDFISFSQPIGFGMGYLQLEELMKKQPSAALAVSAIKLTVVAISALTFFEVSSHSASMMGSSFMSSESLVEGSKQMSRLILPDFTPILHSPVAMGAVFYTGIVTTSIALWVESIAFQRVPATDASVILTTEPLFAAAASAVLVGEKFGLSDAVGAMFIVGACIFAIKMGEAKEVCDEKTMECTVTK